MSAEGFDYSNCVFPAIMFLSFNFNPVHLFGSFYLQHHAKNKKCFVCNQPTLGIFNTAHEIRKKMAAEGK